MQARTQKDTSEPFSLSGSRVTAGVQWSQRSAASQQAQTVWSLLLGLQENDERTRRRPKFDRRYATAPPTAGAI